jgi:DNA-binding winged helix-turn-helix (wHTH) protein/Tol biopolymer transport system component
MTSSDVGPVYEFGPFRLNPSERLLLRDGQPVALKPKAFDLLVFLVERQGHLVSKDELMEGLWPGTFVEEANLTYTVSILRRALGDKQDGDQFIQTVPTRGYRFVPPVRQERGTDNPRPAGDANRVQRPTRVFLASTVAIVLLLVAAGIGWRSRASRPSNVSEYVLTRVTTDVGLTAFPTISRDGKLVAYASDRGGAGNLDIWVQQVGSGSALRLTNDAADDYEPSLSPDATRIAFRSNRNGGGIYVVSVLGGEPKLVAHEGRQPRFSPDGKWIAYWVGIEHLFGDTYVVSADGGPPRRIGLGNEEKKHPFDWSQTRTPLWSPDGRRLLVSTWTDWWVVPVGEGIAVQTGALDLIRASGLGLPQDNSVAFAPEDWDSDEGDAVIFSAISGDSRNLWKIGIDADTWRATGPPTRFTFGTEVEQQVSLSGNRRMVFASLTRISNIWSLPFDPNHGRVTSEPRAITQEARQLTRPDVSGDGRILVYQDETHPSDIRLRNLETGKEIGGFNPAEEENFPVVSADGSTVFYTGPPDRIYALSTAGGIPRLICEKCGTLRAPFALSPDGGRLAHLSLAPDAVMEFELRTGRRKRITRAHHIPESQREMGVSEMRYSPDGRWLAFHALDGVRRHIFLVDTQATENGDAQWVAATTEPSNADGRVGWSPDGNLLYFVSDRDAFRCIWAQRLDPNTKHPVDRPFAVYHLHQTAHRLSHNVGRVGVAVGPDKIVFAMEEFRGNVWMRDPAPSQ